MDQMAPENQNPLVNGQPPAPPTPPEQPSELKTGKTKAASVATRVEKLEAELAELKVTVAQAGALLVGLIESQAVAQSMPRIEQGLRSQIQQAYAQGGLGALLPRQPGAQPQGPPPPQPQQGTPAP
jgi:hypothetical protein